MLGAKIGYMVINFENHFFIGMPHPFHCEFEIGSGIAEHGAVAMTEIVRTNGECFPIGKAQRFRFISFSNFDECFDLKLYRVGAFFLRPAMMPALRVAVQLSFNRSDVRIPSTGKGAFRHQAAAFACGSKKAVHAAQLILQDGEQRYFAFTCFSFWIAENGLITFVVDSMANVNNMMLKIYILRQY